MRAGGGRGLDPTPRVVGMLAASSSARSSASTSSVPEFYKKLLLQMVTDGRNGSVGRAVRSWLWEGAQPHIQPRLQPTMAQKSHGCLDCATARCWWQDPNQEGAGRRQEVPRSCCPSAGGGEQPRPGPCSLLEYPKASSVWCCWAGAPFRKGSRR